MGQWSVDLDEGESTLVEEEKLVRARSNSKRDTTSISTPDDKDNDQSVVLMTGMERTPDSAAPSTANNNSSNAHSTATANNNNPRRPRPLTQHQLAVEQNRRERVEYILAKRKNELYSEFRAKRESQVPLAARYARLLQCMPEDGQDEGADTEKRRGEEEDDYGECASYYLSVIRKAERRLDRWDIDEANGPRKDRKKEREERRLSKNGDVHDSTAAAAGRDNDNAVSQGAAPLASGAAGGGGGSAATANTRPAKSRSRPSRSKRKPDAVSTAENNPTANNNKNSNNNGEKPTPSSSSRAKSNRSRPSRASTTVESSSKKHLSVPTSSSSRKRPRRPPSSTVPDHGDALDQIDKELLGEAPDNDDTPVQTPVPVSASPHQRPRRPPPQQPRSFPSLSRNARVDESGDSVMADDDNGSLSSEVPSDLDVDEGEDLGARYGSVSMGSSSPAVG